MRRHLKYLWSGVGLGSAVGLAEVAKCRLAHEAEVADLDVVACVDQKVLQLEIAVRDVQVVHVPDCRRDLGGPHACSVLADSARRLDVFERVAAGSVL